MKILIITLLSLNVLFSIFSQTRISSTYWSYPITMNSNERRGITFQTDYTYTSDFWGMEESGTFQILNEDEIFYFVFNGTRKLAIFNDYMMLLYNVENDELFFEGIDPNATLFPVINVVRGEIDSTSYLIEGNTHYEPNNLTNINLNSPWVEDAPGWGIGEEIYFQHDGFELYISNGYVSATKPYLYLDNGRVKTLQITTPSDPNPFIYTIEDTPNFQFIPLPESFWGNPITIKILDVYEGRKYEDTCINIIVSRIQPPGINADNSIILE